MLNPILNFNILSYLVAVFDLNSNFSNFPIATGKKWCGGMRVFGLWHKPLAIKSFSPEHIDHAVGDRSEDSFVKCNLWKAHRSHIGILGGVIHL
jgi:hypothetical protein